MEENATIYLDYHATTPVDPRVLEVMLPFFSTRFGNAASRQHAYGWDAEEAVLHARDQVARLVNAAAAEIVFNSGGTESNNHALLGSVRNGEPNRHLITTSVEHPSVLGPCRALGMEGHQVTYLPVSGDGVVSPDIVSQHLRSETRLVSIMLANHEVGSINDVAAVGALCNRDGVIFHVDAVQGIGKIPFDVQQIGCDLASISAHKIYGPKGVGALYVRATGGIIPAPLMYGGGHEDGLRPGTLPVPLIVGFGKAAELAVNHMVDEGAAVSRLRDHLWEQIRCNLDGVRRNGPATPRLPGNLNVAFEDVDGDTLTRQLIANGLAVSNGAACATGSPEPSTVLTAIGVPSDLARASIRFGLGRFTSKQEIERAVSVIVTTVRGLRAGSRS